MSSLVKLSLAAQLCLLKMGVESDMFGAPIGKA